MSAQQARFRWAIHRRAVVYARRESYRLSVWYWRLKFRRLPSVVADRWQNLRFHRRGPTILVLRQHYFLERYNEHFLRWITAHARPAAKYFKFARVPNEQPSYDDVRLILTWVQDPIRERFPAIYDCLKRIESDADARGIPMMNRVDAMSNSIKSRAAGILTAAGIRTPRMIPITDPAAFRAGHGGLAFPMIVRENRGHGGDIHLVHSVAELDAVPIEKMAEPVAIEFVDTKRADGLYRKYRYVVLGETGAPRHCVVSTHWEVRAEARVFNDATIAEETEFLSRDISSKDAAVFHRAAKALAMDVVAFDYSYTRDGELIIWEANPAAVLGWDRMPESLRYQLPAMHRLYQAMLDFYLDAAGLPRVRAHNLSGAK